MNEQNKLQKVQPATKPRALDVMASRLSFEPEKLLGCLKATVFKNASNEELMALVAVSNEYALNPLLKEIYAFPAKGGGIVPVVSIDGWIKMTNRSVGFDGVEFEYENDENGNPVSCTAIIHVKDRSRPIKVTEYLDECKRNTDPWNNMPRRMLRHKALIQCSRVAFGFSGVYDDDEAIDVASIVVDTTPAKEPKNITATTPSLTQTEPETTPQDQLSTIVTAAGYNFDTLMKWAVRDGQTKEGPTCFDELPADFAGRMVKAQKGLLSALKAEVTK